ncbi:hypothetical protein APHAL10511_008544 [Amanita phalloides]|nr:hypothetical protein APHAL10511_008544 [Amanita phalloides]
MSWLRNGKKIVAIGRNYADHIKELNNPPPPEPFFFLKPTTSYLPSGGTLEIPRGVTAHHEVELALIISKRARDVPISHLSTVTDYIAGYTLAVDMTARNVQSHAKSLGLPWSTAKGFDGFTPISPAFLPASLIPDPHALRLTLSVNGQLKQDGLTKDMIFKIPRLISHVSSIMTLEEGDVLLTGTPAGVGLVKPGDRVACKLLETEGKTLAELEFSVVQREGGYVFDEKE